MAEISNGNKKKTHPTFVYLFAATVGMGGVLFGYGTAVISGAMLFIQDRFHLTTFQMSLTVSMLLAGAFFGALISGKITEKLGRKNSLLLGAAVFLIGSLICGFAVSDTMLLAGRFIVGLIIGMTSFIVPLYISEIAPTSLRGRLVIINTLAVTGGMLGSYILNVFLAPMPHNWRFMLGIGVLPAAFMFGGLLFLPQSPRWLMKRGRRAHARLTLEKIRHIDEVEAELEAIEAVINSQQSHSKWSDLLKHKYRGVMVVGIGLAIIQLFTGCNAVLYFAPVIFKNSGFSGITAQLMATVGVGAANFLFTIVAIWLVDKLGRRFILNSTLAGMSIMLLMISVLLRYSATNSLCRYFLIGAMIIYISCFALGLGNLFWLLISEIYPLRIRAKAMSLATSINWLSNMVVAMLFLEVVNRIGSSGAFAIFTIISVASMVFCYLLVPETKGVSLEKIEANLNSGKSVRDIGLPVTHKMRLLNLFKGHVEKVNKRSNENLKNTETV
ncbi:MAG: sugar porter family MFS transporter [Lentisphaerae bacterium]|nr:sugar porter family MFS transporter [Lentisphaerota bacterium]MCP4103311.1 sugar porter family MFS transporter [Lentisphaerota bacterium]